MNNHEVRAICLELAVKALEATAASAEQVIDMAKAFERYIEAGPPAAASDVPEEYRD